GERDDAGKMWASLAFSERHLFIGPWLIAAGPAWGLGPCRDRIGQEVAHERPLLDRLDRRLRVLLLRRPISQAIEKGLHERRPDHVNRISPKRVRPLRKAKQVAVAGARRQRQRVKFRARKIGPDDFGETAASNVPLSLPHGSPP